ncbi:MAG: hypothetical protein ACOWYE_01170 [Desulfatiglandales bacterium]
METWILYEWGNSPKRADFGAGGVQTVRIFRVIRSRTTGSGKGEIGCLETVPALFHYPQGWIDVNGEIRISPWLRL